MPDLVHDSSLFRPRFRRSKIRIHFERGMRGRRMRKMRKWGGASGSLHLRNRRLLLRNRCIMQENERLRQKAILLNEQNRALLSQLAKIRLFPTSSPNLSLC